MSLGVDDMSCWWNMQVRESKVMALGGLLEGFRFEQQLGNLLLMLPYISSLVCGC